MTFIKVLGITATIAAFGLGSAYANEAGKEASPHKSEHRLNADVNQDGKVSYEEFRAAGEKRMEKHFKHMDANGDGFIDQTEKQAMRDKWSEKRKVKGERCHKPDAAKTY